MPTLRKAAATADRIKLTMNKHEVVDDLPGSSKSGSSEKVTVVLPVYTTDATGTLSSKLLSYKQHKSGPGELNNRSTFRQSEAAVRRNISLKPSSLTFSNRLDLIKTVAIKSLVPDSCTSDHAGVKQNLIFMGSLNEEGLEKSVSYTHDKDDGKQHEQEPLIDFLSSEHSATNAVDSGLMLHISPDDIVLSHHKDFNHVEREGTSAKESQTRKRHCMHQTHEHLSNADSSAVHIQEGTFESIVDRDASLTSVAECYVPVPEIVAEETEVVASDGAPDLMKDYIDSAKAETLPKTSSVQPLVCCEASDQSDRADRPVTMVTAGISGSSLENHHSVQSWVNLASSFGDGEVVPSQRLNLKSYKGSTQTISTCQPESIQLVPTGRLNTRDRYWHSVQIPLT